MKLEGYRLRISIPRSLSCAAIAAALVVTGGCDDGSDGKDGAPGDPPMNSDLEPDEDAPGVNITILSVTGASGAGGSFRVGDTPRVTYTVTMDNGSAWNLDEFSRGRIMFSGPTFNYQRVIEEQRDLHTASQTNKDGSHTYTFPVKIPAVYAAPLNDTPSFDADDGELTGMPLLAGTYTVGIYMNWDYTVEEESFRDVGNATFDVLFGGAATLTPRELVTIENCNQCHEDLQAHGGLRREPTLCLLCHTAGSEDRNTPTVAGGTPGASIDFKVMIHKIHNGKHLPSVLGMGVNADGSRDYTKTPEPYQLVGFNDSLHDYSEVAFPIWPSLSFPMPRDAGYSMLDSDEQDLEDEQREGVVSCFACHGDPDGAGPLTAPAQGDIALQQPSRNACGSCHDDIDWELPYNANNQTMPFQLTDSTCTQCHPQSGNPLAVEEGHAHPLLDPTIVPGLNFELMSVDEAGMNDGSGTIDPGEKIALTFRMTDDMGAEVDPDDVASISTAMAGPTTNFNLIQHIAIPTAALSGAQPYTVNVPNRNWLELAGTSTAALESFTTSQAPHWNVSGATTNVFTRTATGGGSAFLAEDATAPINFIDVDDSTNFERDDYIVIDDGLMGQEFLQIQFVEGNRLWFASSQQTDYPPGTVLDHLAGATVDEVTLTALTEDVDYTLDGAMGIITELVEFGDGNEVVVTYTTDLLMPAVYPLALNDSPDFGDEVGKWVGKSIVDGTYNVGLWGYLSISFDLFGETNSFRAAADSVSQDVLVGAATDIEPYELIASENSCYSCHQDLYFHGGTRRGFDSCILCHGTSGSEDRPQYRAANAPATTQVEVRFREMLHKIHMGADLANASTYTIVGFGLGYPDNFSEHTYGEVEFPTFPGGTKHCESCHGDGNTAWQIPNSGDHPTEQLSPSQPWSASCGACHDSVEAQTHIESQISTQGLETCVICHEDGLLSPAVVHKTR